jgi:ABC-type uncharacterized transport system auxiliary subunit
MQAAMIAALRRADVSPRVVSPDLRVLADWRVDGKLQRLDYAPGSDSRVVVRMELSLVDTSDGEVLLLDTFEVTQPVGRDAVPAAVRAFNAATAELLGRFLDRLAEQARPKSAAAR